MIETHPFGTFVPPKAKYLLLGSFVAKNQAEDPNYNWYYGTKRNQFWPIIEQVYDIKLPDKKAKQLLFTNLHMAIGDILLQCERKKGNSLDANLTNCVYNINQISDVLKHNKIEKIFFTSRFVENGFKKHFQVLVEEHPNIELITLPSPSPRYAAMRFNDKVARYKELLPGL